MSLRQPELYQIVDRVPACVRDMLLGQMILISCKWQANVYDCRILESLKMQRKPRNGNQSKWSKPKPS